MPPKKNSAEKNEKLTQLTTWILVFFFLNNIVSKTMIIEIFPPKGNRTEK